MPSPAVLLMAHGTPASMDDMADYLRIVRGGRPASDELVAEMRHNYEAIGGRSPLTAITQQQAQALQTRLGERVTVAVGMRTWHPFIKDVLANLCARGCRRVIGIPLAPQFSTVSVQRYLDAASSALPAGAAFEAVRSFHAHPQLIEAFAERVRAAQPTDGEHIVFTAHSVPKRVVDAGDVYPDEVAKTAQLVAAAAGVPKYEIVYQSAGRTPEPWIGPDLNAFLADRATSGARRFLVVPIGFVCDHTEILFDIDVQAAATARAHGASLRRTESLNTSPAFISMLEDVVHRCLEPSDAEE